MSAKLRLPDDSNDNSENLGQPDFVGGAISVGGLLDPTFGAGFSLTDGTISGKGGSSSLTSGGVLKEYRAGSVNGDAGYDIWIEFKGTNWTTTLQTAFKNAADYLTTVISGDIGGGGLYRGKLIDDLYVSAELKAIDGTGGILGQSGPTATWTSNDLTAAGQMQFDVADAKS